MPDGVRVLRLRHIAVETPVAPKELKQRPAILSLGRAGLAFYN